MIIGSGRLANMRLDHPEIELAHVKVTWDDNGISMIDNGSRKGTWVNGEPVETTALLDGDVIEFVEPGSQGRPPRRSRSASRRARCPSRPRRRPRPRGAGGTFRPRRRRPRPARRRRARESARRRKKAPDLPDLAPARPRGRGRRPPRGRRLGRKAALLHRAAGRHGGARPGRDGQTITISGAPASTATRRTTWSGSATAGGGVLVADGALQVKVPAVPHAGTVAPRSRPRAVARGRSRSASSAPEAPPRSTPRAPCPATRWS